MTRGRANEGVAVAIVTHDSAEDLPGCLESVAALEPRPREVVVVDCASSDGSVRIAEDFAAHGDLRVEVRPLGRNAGFAGGMNEAIAATAAPWVLSLNPDARPAPDLPKRLLERAERGADLRVGALTPRLVRPTNDAPRRLDACGMALRRAWRHLDRGSGEPDHGQYAEPERVFGATGAAALFRREALLDVALPAEPGRPPAVFDPLFHSYREDAELAFRLHERGWEVLYEPRAVCEHRRRVLPERRASLPAAINRHSLKNRYLLRAYHQSVGNLVRTLPWTLPRDLGALAWVLLRERSSLPAYAWLWRHRRQILERRRWLRARRTATAESVERWFRIEGLPMRE